jgi:hypothetical protein
MSLSAKACPRARPEGGSRFADKDMRHSRARERTRRFAGRRQSSTLRRAHSSCQRRSSASRSWRGVSCPWADAHSAACAAPASDCWVREMLDMTRSFRSIPVLAGDSGAIDGSERRRSFTAAMLPAITHRSIGASDRGSRMSRLPRSYQPGADAPVRITGPPAVLLTSPQPAARERHSLPLP